MTFYYNNLFVTNQYDNIFYRFIIIRKKLIYYKFKVDTYLFKTIANETAKIYFKSSLSLYACRIITSKALYKQ